MNYGSVCSGIEAATVAWHPLGWKPVWFSEIEKFPGRVLAHHYPNVPNLGDMTKLSDHEEYINTAINLLVGGTPCQSFSIAGLRGGLDTANGNLALEYCRILLKKQPRWFVWENVPGVFSSFTDEAAGAVNFHSNLEPGDEYSRDITETADFATLLEAFRECGYSVAYRVLDSQYFGVPQRRRRVFVVGYLGDDWRPPAAVLFEPESLRRDLTPSREKGEVVAALTKSGVGTCGADDNQAQAGHLIVDRIESYGIQGCWIGRKPENGGNAVEPMYELSPCLTKADRHGVAFAFGGNNTSGAINTATACNAHGSGRLDFESETFIVHPQVYSIMPMNSGKDYKARQVEVSQPLMSGGPVGGNQGGDYVLYQPKSALDENWALGEIKNALRKGESKVSHCIANPPYVVRRLTPLECERLQGFPDNYTNIPVASDSARYAAIGNSMTTYVMRWIGERIDLVDKIIHPATATKQ